MSSNTLPSNMAAFSSARNHYLYGSPYLDYILRFVTQTHKKVIMPKVIHLLAILDRAFLRLFTVPDDYH